MDGNPLGSLLSVLWLAHVLSRRVGVLGGLVGGLGLQGVGARGQGLGDGQRPGHHPLHGPSDPTRGHHARREHVN